MGCFLYEPAECADLFATVSERYQFEFEAESQSAVCALCRCSPAPTDLNTPEALIQWLQLQGPSLGNMEWLHRRTSISPVLQAHSSVRPLASARNCCPRCASQLGTTVFVPRSILSVIHDALRRDEQEFLVSSFVLDVCGICRNNQLSPTLTSRQLLEAYMRASELDDREFSRIPGATSFVRIARLIDDVVERRVS